MNSKPEVPVFFATDDNYAPFLAVTFKSILDNASKDFSYKFYVLTTNLSSSYEKRIKEFESEDVKIEFTKFKAADIMDAGIPSDALLAIFDLIEE